MSLDFIWGSKRTKFRGTNKNFVFKPDRFKVLQHKALD